MGRSLQVELPIEEAYVPLQTTLARSLEQRPTERYREGYAEHEQRVDLGNVFRKASQLGSAGWYCWASPARARPPSPANSPGGWPAARACRRTWGCPVGTVPILLRFRNLRRETLAGSEFLCVFLEAETCCEEAPDGLDAPGPDLWNGRGGPLLWILDGLDEVIDPEKPRKTSRRLGPQGGGGTAG